MILTLLWCPDCGTLYGNPRESACCGRAEFFRGMDPYVPAECRGKLKPARIVATHRSGVTDQGMIDISVVVDE